jgi:alpha-methylacyl-CoA racemase
VTGWGQDGPLAQTAGHDINYLALSGALSAIGTTAAPVVPLNLVADCGGGAMLLALGVVSAALHAQRSGEGQVVDAAMTDGAAILMTMIHTWKAMGEWNAPRGENLLDGGAHFYGTYRCADGKWLAVGAIEAPFYAQLLNVLGVTDPAFAEQWNRPQWPALKEKLAALIAGKTRDQWCELFAGSDACVAPVLDLDEAPVHPHNRARATFIEVDGVAQAAPAPRFSRTVCAPPSAPDKAPSGVQALADWGLPDEVLSQFEASGVLQ